MPSSTPAQVALDAFPVKAVLGTGAEHRKARAVVVDGRLDVWTESAGQFGRVLSEPILSVEGAHLDAGLAIATDSGVTMLRRDSGCGCGARLRSADVLEGRSRRLVSLDSI